MKKFIYFTFVLLVISGIALFAFTPVRAADTFEDYYRHESRPHIPRPSKQADVAVGVGVSTLGIVVLNSLSNTSVFGSTPFNSSFNPLSQPKPAAPSSPAGSGGGFLNMIGRFFKSLFDTLKDMLTDEGRSYASGMITEIIDKHDQ
jgi:hypothetical protein